MVSSGPGVLLRVNVKHLLAAIVLGLSATGAVVACPECQVANAGMGKDKPASNPSVATTNAAGDGSTSGFWSKFHLAMGVDVPSAYIYRGYVQADSGLIVQPFLTLSYDLVNCDDLTIRPYANWTNTFLDTDNGKIKHQHGTGEKTVTKDFTYLDPGHPGNPKPHTHTIQVDALEGADGRPWYESQVTLGAVIDRGDFTIDLKYHVCLYPDDSHEAVHELGAKLTYDMEALWDKRSELERTFRLRPSVLLLHEVADLNGPEDTYIELGIEPQWRVKVAGQSFGISAPFAIAMSPDGYFTDSNGGDEALGFWSAGIRASWMLPIDQRYGRWFINASCTYVHFLSDSTELSNGGDIDNVVTSFGVGVAF